MTLNLPALAFGGTWADRAAEIRDDASKLDAALGARDARVVPIWRGKPMICDTGLAWLPLDSTILNHAPQPLLFLGQATDEHGAPAPRFAADVSSWEPDALDRAALAMFNDASTQYYPDLPEDHVFADLRMNMGLLGAQDAALGATARALFNWHRTHRFCAACGAPSRITSAGWQRVCDTCAARHFPRTDPVVIMLVTRGNQLLMGRSPGWPERMYSLLAGFVEPGETLEAAVTREIREETSIRLGPVQYLASQPWPFPNSLMFGCKAEALSSEIVIDPELDDALWLSRERVLAAWSGEDPQISPARKGSIAHYLIGLWLAGKT